MRGFVAAMGVICLVAAFGGLATADPATNGSAGVDSGVQATSQTIEIRLQENGNANISVYKEFSLDAEGDRAAFARLARGFEDNASDNELSAAMFERLVDRADNETDRQMDVEGITRETHTSGGTGTLELRFTWTNFAATTDGRLEVGDAFVIDGRMWLSSLAADQRLIVHAPEDYAVENASTSVTNGTMVWTGPQEFERGALDITLVASETRSDGGGSWLTIALGLGFVASVALLLYSLARPEEAIVRSDGTGDARGQGQSRMPPVVSGEGDHDGGSTASAPGPPPEREADGERGSGTDSESESEPESDDPLAGINEALLSDEERVIRLLEANGGRMKQATIVTETDWSNAKVSQLLSSMAEDGRIEKLRIGRENLISLADEE